jgi:hypothetical protein
MRVAASGMNEDVGCGKVIGQPVDVHETGEYRRRSRADEPLDHFEIGSIAADKETRITPSKLPGTGDGRKRLNGVLCALARNKFADRDPNESVVRN